MPVAGRLKRPRTVLDPFTSSALPGVVVLIPTLAVLPVPDWNSTELPMVAVPVHRGKKLTVPEPVIVLAAGALPTLPGFVAPEGAVAAPGAGVASPNAD